jgi:hypothetical protein
MKPAVIGANKRMVGRIFSLFSDALSSAKRQFMRLLWMLRWEILERKLSSFPFMQAFYCIDCPNALRESCCNFILPPEGAISL